ncbi:hypothetical protein EXN66_Car019037 [Channa argus]|uniref:Uncharacterized protein n=1 Tax=Channa argus TaxID=215402 RepID=A0A6G1QLV9_CHAAH|nr:hypothetical protein EXN66_Car019037 [Channa argus]
MLCFCISSSLAVHSHFLLDQSVRVDLKVLFSTSQAWEDCKPLRSVDFPVSIAIIRGREREREEKEERKN